MQNRINEIKFLYLKDKIVEKIKKINEIFLYWYAEFFFEFNLYPKYERENIKIMFFI